MKKVKEIPEFQRPREKIKEKGIQTLSDKELVAVLLGSGGKERDVMTLAAQVARLIHRNKGQLDLEMITAVKGIGPAKASQILAGFELARRHLFNSIVRITGPETAVPLVSYIADKKQEYFVCISLNGAHEVIETRTVTIGLVNESQIHPREVFADVISDRAASVIFAHNHPSGTLTPSPSDLTTHNRLTEAGKILGINVLDHIIVSQKGYASFQELGLLD